MISKVENAKKGSILEAKLKSRIPFYLSFGIFLVGSFELRSHQITNTVGFLQSDKYTYSVESDGIFCLQNFLNSLINPSFILQGW